MKILNLVIALLITCLLGAGIGWILWPTEISKEIQIFSNTTTPKIQTTKMPVTTTKAKKTSTFKEKISESSRKIKEPTGIGRKETNKISEHISVPALNSAKKSRQSNGLKTTHVNKIQPKKSNNSNMYKSQAQNHSFTSHIQNFTTLKPSTTSVPVPITTNQIPISLSKTMTMSPRLPSTQSDVSVPNQFKTTSMPAKLPTNDFKRPDVPNQGKFFDEIQNHSIPYKIYVSADNFTLKPQPRVTHTTTIPTPTTGHSEYFSALTGVFSNKASVPYTTIMALTKGSRTSTGPATIDPAKQKMAMEGNIKKFPTYLPVSTTVASAPSEKTLNLTTLTESPLIKTQIDHPIATDKGILSTTPGNGTNVKSEHQDKTIHVQPLESIGKNNISKTAVEIRQSDLPTDTKNHQTSTMMTRHAFPSQNPNTTATPTIISSTATSNATMTTAIIVPFNKTERKRMVKVSYKSIIRRLPLQYISYFAP